MSFALTEEQEELRRVVRRFFDLKAHDDAAWDQLADELELPALHIPEAFGGQGYSFIELAVAFEEAGRVLLSAPLFSTVGMAANAILAAGSDEQRSRLLPAIASGKVRAAAALTEADRGFVVDGMTADLLVVRMGGTLQVVDATQVERQPLTTLDLTRPQAAVTLHGVPGEQLGDGDPAAMATALDWATVCLAAEMAGGARHCLEASVAYATERIQFGVPIGSFQAIKHQLAELHTKVEQATSLVYQAARAAAEDDPDLALAASVAKAWCSDVYTEVATENIQIHGGIGFTWEHDAHRYFRRARSSEVMLGDAAAHRERIAGLFLD